MKLLFDYFPIILFFLSFKLYGIYVATIVVIISAILQIGIFWLKYRRFSLVHLITAGVLLIFGGTTLILKNPIFIKWKPTVVFWLLATICLASRFMTQKTFIQYILDKKMTLPKAVWHKINYSWAVFFFTTGTVNLYVAYNCSTNTWVNFKLFGVVGATLVFSLFQSFYIAKQGGDRMDQVQKPEGG